DTARDEPDSCGSAGSGDHVVPPVQTQPRLYSPEPKFDVVRGHHVAVGHDRPVVPPTRLSVTVGRSCHEVPFQCRVVKLPNVPVTVMQLVALPPDTFSAPAP